MIVLVFLLIDLSFICCLTRHDVSPTASLSRQLPAIDCPRVPHRVSPKAQNPLSIIYLQPSSPINLMKVL